jgi:hypothetical protein
MSREPKNTQKPAKNIKPDTIAGYNGKSGKSSESYGFEPLLPSGIGNPSRKSGYNGIQY